MPARACLAKCRCIEANSWPKAAAVGDRQCEGPPKTPAIMRRMSGYLLLQRGQVPICDLLSDLLCASQALAEINRQGKVWRMALVSVLEPPISAPPQLLFRPGSSHWRRACTPRPRCQTAVKSFSWLLVAANRCLFGPVNVVLG